MKSLLLPPPASGASLAAGHARQHGIAMLEVLGALAIGAMILLGLAAMMNDSVDDLKGQQAAYYQSQFVAAANKYISANSATLQSATTSSSTVVAVTLAQLKSALFLPSETASTNDYQQTPCLLVRQPDPSGNPGVFEALVTTTGGSAIPEKELPAVAMNAGPGSGYISTTDTATAKGATWSLATTAYRSTACSGASALTGASADGGHLVSMLFTDGSGMLSTDYLYRNPVSGHPELNRMNTALRMASAALVSSGSSCLDSSGTATPGIALDSSTRVLLTCTAAGTWSAASQWKEPVASYAALPSGTVGDVRMVTSLGRAFMYNGSSWQALAVDQNGNFVVPGLITTANLDATEDITARNVTTTENVAAGQNITAGGTIYASGDISTGGSVSAAVNVNATNQVNAYDVNASHNVVTQGMESDRWTSSPAITLGYIMTPGAACNYYAYDSFEGTTHIVLPYGTMLMDANYVPLICGADATFRYANGTYSP